MNLIFICTLLTALISISTLPPSEGSPWISHQTKNPGWSWGQAQPAQNQPFNPLPTKRPFSPPSQGCGPSNPNRPSQSPPNQPISFKPLPNEHLVKPVINAWPRPIQNQNIQHSQAQQNQWQIPNQSLVKPVFSAWPRPTSTSNQRPLVDVPFTIEIVQSGKAQNNGWSR